MLSARAVALCAALVACRNDSDPGFEIVRVPLSAYAAPDASTRADSDAGAAGPGEPEPVVLCITPASKGDDDENSDDDTDCAATHHGRAYDSHATDRHRKKDGEEHVCCYRRGRSPRSRRDEDE
ncbi:MAG TPA: hypothetical protein VGH28_32735 [Polyangiaceae bacterium]|jgi:hypothetical protein